MITGKVTKIGNVVIEMHENSSLIVEGELILNHNLPEGSHQECIVRLYENSKMIVKGSFLVNYGSVIQVFAGGELVLGSGCFNSNTVVGCNKKIHIGNGFLGGRNAVIYDSDFHKLWVNDEQNTMSSPVRIGNDVWFGINVTVLKGVTIGDGSVVGAGSIVTNDVLPGCLAVGTPARIIKENVRWEV